MNITVKVGNEEVTLAKAVKETRAGHKTAESHKLNAHIVCIVIGVAITIFCTFESSTWALHFGGLLATLPAFVQEFIDWMRQW